jgi:hypothetical protein
MPESRSHLPWTVEELQGSFVVKNATGLTLETYYFGAATGSSEAAKPLDKDEARRMAVNFAGLSKILRRPNEN